MGMYLFCLLLGLFFSARSEASTDYAKFMYELHTLSPYEAYLESQGVYTSHTVAGHITDAQKQQMNEVLASYPKIETIGEIGLNAGHSAENFFTHCNQIKKYYAFDIEPILEVVEYFQKNYKDQFHFFQGDSLETVPAFTRDFPEVKLDLIFIDGAHSYSNCLSDILNMKALAHSGTHVWIDDYSYPDVFEAVASCEKVFGILEVIRVHASDVRTSAERCWIEARYLLETPDR